MVGILLVTHNGLGDCLADCVKHVFGEIPKNLRVLSVWSKDDPQHKLTEGEELIKELDSGSGVLILIDVFGATPSNIGRRLCHADRVEGVAGVNLPMLLRVVVCSRGRPLAEMAQRALDGGRECIVLMNSEAKGCNVATRCADN